tara:strand:- start:667 stop:816 length:150 start_codon:yes stop_codon:yes gene_type:complete
MKIINYSKMWAAWFIFWAVTILGFALLLLIAVAFPAVFIAGLYFFAIQL